MNRALAVQATPDQTSHFPELTRSTETARKLAQALAQLGGKADSVNDFAKQSAALKNALEEAQGANQDFVKSFTKSQKAGLKELAKKLEKADSEVGKRRKELEKQLSQVKAADEGIAGGADKLEKALEELQSQQIELGKEMGITPATLISGILPAAAKSVTARAAKRIQQENTHKNHGTLLLDLSRHSLHDFDSFVPSLVGVGLRPCGSLHDHYVAPGIDVNCLAVDAESSERLIVIV
jgi:chromosome segregation ATPase